MSHGQNVLFIPHAIPRLIAERRGTEPRTGRQVERQRGEDGLLIAATLVEQSEPLSHFEATGEVVLQLEGREGVVAEVHAARSSQPGVVDALCQSEGGGRKSG